MKTTTELVEMLMEKYQLRSVYALAKLLNQTHTSVSRWAKGTGSFSDETAMQVADLLDLDPAYVVACIHAERAKAHEEKALWTRIAERMANEEKMMKLFLISQKQNSDYDTYDSAVVAAPDEDTARLIEPGTGKPVENWNKNYDSWCDGPEHVFVVYIGEAAADIEQGVVCASFNAG